MSGAGGRVFFSYARLKRCRVYFRLGFIFEKVPEKVPGLFS
jgi:hypothetical protein